MTRRTVTLSLCWVLLMSVVSGQSFTNSSGSSSSSSSSISSSSSSSSSSGSGSTLIDNKESYKQISCVEHFSHA